MSVESTATRPIRTRDAYEDLDDEWKITDEMKQRLGSSEWLRQELSDGGLRHLILQIYGASNVVASSRSTETEQECLLEQLKSDYPRFERFMDKLLVLAGALERQGQDAERPLNEWLGDEGNDDVNPLLLKPLPGRGHIPGDAQQSDEKRRKSTVSTASSESSDDDTSSDDTSESSDEE